MLMLAQNFIKIGFCKNIHVMVGVLDEVVKPITIFFMWSFIKRRFLFLFCPEQLSTIITITKCPVTDLGTRKPFQF